MEEQAAERETERDDYSKEIISLQAQLKEKGKNLSSQERFTTEVISQKMFIFCTSFVFFSFATDTLMILLIVMLFVCQLHRFIMFSN